MSIATKIEILKNLDNGKKISALVKRYRQNESTIFSIRNNAEKIRETAASIGAQ